MGPFFIYRIKKSFENSAGGAGMGGIQYIFENIYVVKQTLVWKVREIPK